MGGPCWSSPVFENSYLLVEISEHKALAIRLWVVLLLRNKRYFHSLSCSSSNWTVHESSRNELCSKCLSHAVLTSVKCRGWAGLPFNPNFLWCFHFDTNFRHEPWHLATVCNCWYLAATWVHNESSKWRTIFSLCDLPQEHTTCSWKGKYLISQFSQYSLHQLSWLKIFFLCINGLFCHCEDKSFGFLLNSYYANLGTLHINLNIQA